MSATQWAGQDFPVMWQSAQAADTNMAWRQVSAWQETYDLLLHHETQLRTCRNELSAAWPPERSPAAQSFIAYLDAVLIHIGYAREDALANRTALGHALSSLAATKADMAKLKDRWDRYESEEKARSQNLSNMLPHSAGNDWRRALNEHARTRMTQNDEEVFQATQQMIVPTPVIPTIGPHEPLDPSSTNRSGVGSAGRAGSAISGDEGWMRAPTIPSVSDLDGGAGLAGGSVPPVPSPLTPAGPGSGQPSSTGNWPGAPPPLWPVGRPPVAGAPGTAGPLPGAAKATSTGGLRPGAGVGPGGVIGPRPSTGSPPLGHGVVGPVPGGRRVNPVGGVIGSHGGAGGPAGMPLAGAGRGGEPRRLRPERDPYNVWAVDEGVPPVIEPTPERPHSPGPGVFGIDR